MINLPIEPFLHRFDNKLYINSKDLNCLLENHNVDFFIPHKHDFNCILLFTEGSGSVILDFNTIEIKPKHALIILKNQISQLIKPINYKAKVLLFTEEFFCIDDLHFQFFYRTELFNLLGNCSLIDVSKRFEELITLFDLSKRELDKGFYSKQQHILNNYLFNILLVLETSLDTVFSENLHIRKDRLIVSSFKALVNKKLDKSMSLKNYAKELKVTKRAIEYAFMKVENRTPYSWMSERFITEIKRNLIYKNITINEIAYNIGFKEPHHLTVFFKKQTGETPLRFRKLGRKTNEDVVD